AGTPQPLIDKFQVGVAKVASNPEFQKRHMNSRALTAVLNTSEEFAKQLAEERDEGLEAVKASGLYPNIKEIVSERPSGKSERSCSRPPFRRPLLVWRAPTTGRRGR